MTSAGSRSRKPGFPTVMGSVRNKSWRTNQSGSWVEVHANMRVPTWVNKKPVLFEAERENNQREHITSKMPHQIAILIVGVVVAVLAVYVGQNPVGPVEAWMKTVNLSITIGLNATVQLYWGGGLIGGNLTPFRFTMPCDQVMPVA
ncbi:hypothetical protein EDB92DRAFT_1820227 [Lactarius akahatsu]|uniref:Uncharacterized protein n=1 Tax=Lactarius akahatsu TaxID=416441 RepID=A0AAD4Q672_9AGAM|nr:hypothetical protein EDB92DRAFT_1820227 [Lactarius akahatsu]